MFEQLHGFATNWIYMVPFMMLCVAAWLKFEKSQKSNPSKSSVLNNQFILRNSLLAGFITFLIMYFGRPLPSLDESIIVSPADF